VSWRNLFVKLHLSPLRQSPTRTLPTRMWTAAGRLARLVAKYRGIPAEAVNRLNRVLSDQHFMFRGGGRATAADLA
jgi:hypothetical protein